MFLISYNIILIYYIFVSGKISAGASANKEGSPLSQPPTPPSTPLSPKTNDLSQRLSHLTSLSFSHQSSQSSQKLPQSHISSTQNVPLNLGKKIVQNVPNEVDMNLSFQQQTLDFSQGSSPELEALRNRISDDGFLDQKNALTGRVS